MLLTISTTHRPATDIGLAALEVMSRFAANPKWLIYLPPTMSPTETTSVPGLLEHPAEAFAFYRHEGVPQVICEQKHMGSRAVVIVCRDEETARRRFGVIGESGVCYTRTGRRFFDDATLENALLAEVRAALTATDFWDEHQTDWVCLDCELMPWSAKAQALVRGQYAAVGAAARSSLPAAVEALTKAAERGLDVAGLLATSRDRLTMAEQYVESYRRYCWPVESLADLHRRARTLCRPRAAAPHSRMRLRRARLGERAGRPAALALRAFTVGAERSMVFGEGESRRHIFLTKRAGGSDTRRREAR